MVSHSIMQLDVLKLWFVNYMAKISSIHFVRSRDICRFPRTIHCVSTFTPSHVVFPAYDIVPQESAFWSVRGPPNVSTMQDAALCSVSSKESADAIDERALESYDFLLYSRGLEVPAMGVDVRKRRRGFKLMQNKGPLIV